jgi:hypothetical protein
MRPGAGASQNGSRAPTAPAAPFAAIAAPYETKYGLELAIGAFDDPTVAAPVIQVNLADKLPFFDDLTGLPGRVEIDPEWADFLAGIHSNQHPDHDTDDWPPKPRGAS